MPGVLHSSVITSGTGPAGITPALSGVRNVDVTGNLAVMVEAPTGAERYLARRLEDPAYRQAYEDARERIDQIDSVIRALDARREELDLTKAELARRAGVKPEAIRRLFSAEKPNPTLTTLVALAGALDLEILPRPRKRNPVTPARSAASGTRRRTA
jgi:DNA-binding XRE family transcriptional regulator